MRRWLCIAFFAGIMAAALPARAEGEALPEIRIKVGEAFQLHLGFIIVGLVCDDTSVVRVEDGGDHLRLVGLAPGQTKCGFWSNPKSPAPSKVYEVVVTRAPPKLQPWPLGKTPGTTTLVPVLSLFDLRQARARER